MTDSLYVDESINIDSLPAAPDATPAAAGQDRKPVLDYVRSARKAGAVAAKNKPQTDKGQSTAQSANDAGKPLYDRIQAISGKPINQTGMKRLTSLHPKVFGAGRRQIAAECQIAERNVVRTRNSLAEKGYVTVTTAEKPDEPDGVTVNLSWVWNRNFAKYASDDSKVDAFFSLLDMLASDSRVESRLIELADRIRSGGGADIPQAGADIPQGRGGYAPDSVEVNESVNIDSLPAAPDATRTNLV